MLNTYCVPGNVQATEDIKMKVVGDRTHKLTGLPPKCGPRVRYKTLGEQKCVALGMSHSMKASRKRRPESWALEGQCNAVGWGAWGPVGEKNRYSRQNEG